MYINTVLLSLMAATLAVAAPFRPLPITDLDPCSNPFTDCIGPGLMEENFSKKLQHKGPDDQSLEKRSFKIDVNNSRYYGEEKAVEPAQSIKNTSDTDAEAMKAVASVGEAPEKALSIVAAADKPLRSTLDKRKVTPIDITKADVEEAIRDYHEAQERADNDAEALAKGQQKADQVLYDEAHPKPHKPGKAHDELDLQCNLDFCPSKVQYGDWYDHLR
ncbi:MAG: hypothetical protein Q9191_006747 [Dirinaria sp. TL-2023a]